MTKLSKVNIFKKYFLTCEGTSKAIKRYEELPKELQYTSGDGIFRSDSQLAKDFKFFRFSETLDFEKKSRYWELCSLDKKMLEDIHRGLSFKKKGNIVEYIQFFGYNEEQIIDQGIHPDISKIIRNERCSNCGYNQTIECDHKNDLKNDPRVLNITTQTIDDFQPLCKRCNCMKRSALAKMRKSGKRYGASELGYQIDFTEGDFTFDKDDPNWYKGSYWGDCVAFKKKLCLINHISN